MDNTLKFEAFGIKKRIKSMLSVDFKRLMRSRLFYILIAAALLMPILMTVMMSMMDGSESVNQQTGEVTVLQGPENAWQNIGALPGSESMGGMDVFAMCNINMMFMAVAIFVCLFISDDFRSGYNKNLFTVRAKKSDYVFSKTVVGFIVGALMLIAYLLGSVIGGAIAQLSFDLFGLSAMNLIMCILSKIFLMLVFVSIFTVISVAVKERAWLSLVLSFGGGMLLFMTVSMITPLDSTPINLILCLIGGGVFAIGLGTVSKIILSKTKLV